MSRLILPAHVRCPHPDSALFGSWQPDENGDNHQLALVCQLCGWAWDEGSIPIDLLERVVAKLQDGTWAKPMGS